MLKEFKKEKSLPVNIKVTADDKKELQKKANEYTQGNLTAWIVYAGKNYVPKPEELTK